MQLPRYFLEFIKQEIRKEYFKILEQKYDLLKQGHILFPKEELIFNCFNYFDVNDLKVIILGQDPYYLNGYANGLAFAVNNDCKIPKSLNNIFLEIQDEYNVLKTDRTLISWAKQGVLLLNTSLCVIENKPNSCKDLGWSEFVRNLIFYLNQKKQNLVYLLWGNNAKQFSKYINEKNNFVLTSAHPSPLSAKNFFHNNHFKKCNEYLLNHNLNPIEW